jgi:hypothetical protein
MHCMHCTACMHCTMYRGRAVNFNMQDGLDRDSNAKRILTTLDLTHQKSPVFSTPLAKW